MIRVRTVKEALELDPAIWNRVAKPGTEGVQAGRELIEAFRALRIRSGNTLVADILDQQIKQVSSLQPELELQAVQALRPTLVERTLTLLDGVKERLVGLVVSLRTRGCAPDRDDAAIALHEEVRCEERAETAGRALAEHIACCSDPNTHHADRMDALPHILKAATTGDTAARAFIASPPEAVHQTLWRFYGDNVGDILDLLEGFAEPPLLRQFMIDGLIGNYRELGVGWCKYEEGWPVENPLREGATRFTSYMCTDERLRSSAHREWASRLLASLAERGAFPLLQSFHLPPARGYAALALEDSPRLSQAVAADSDADPALRCFAGYQGPHIGFAGVRELLDAGLNAMLDDDQFTSILASPVASRELRILAVICLGLLLDMAPGFKGDLRETDSCVRETHLRRGASMANARMRFGTAALEKGCIWDAVLTLTHEVAHNLLLAAGVESNSLDRGCVHEFVADLAVHALAERMRRDTASKENFWDVAGDYHRVACADHATEKPPFAGRRRHEVARAQIQAIKLSDRTVSWRRLYADAMRSLTKNPRLADDFVGFVGRLLNLKTVRPIRDRNAGLVGIWSSTELT